MYLFALLLLLLSLFGILAFVVAGKIRLARTETRLRQIMLEMADDASPAQRLEWRMLLHSFASPLAGQKERAALAAKLVSAGLRSPIALNVFLLAKTGLIILVAISGIFFFELKPQTLLTNWFGTIKYLFILFLAARLPDLWLKDMVTRRRVKIRAAVPQAVDLLVICAESGISLEDSLGRVARELRKMAPEVSAELALTRSEMLIMDRTQALRRLERRTGVRELETMASSLIQSIQYGTPLSEALQLIASDSRASQISELEANAGSISAKVGVPLVVLVLFPLIVMVAAPPVLLFFRSL